MKVDFKTLAAGVVLVAAVPLLLFWQSSNESTGTSKGWSKYNEYQNVSVITMYLANARPENDNRRILHEFCLFTLGRYRNGEYTAAWIDYVASRCGECADVHLARAWLGIFMRDSATMNREFAAARAAAKDQAELDRINEMIDQVMK